ncbi:MAG: tRNA guanosine(34) transglycosylase Tgt [Candidatus Buchananbacteria bacterium]|nr:tRNA guanosine(34) transglycosylase Tgt [Candidatus Buchananbacteria bacterium]
MYRLLKQSKKSQARLGILKTAHGDIQTPFFMPIATKAAVKNLTALEVKSLGAEIILSNTYHLYLQPGLEVLKKLGGLHKMMNWPGPILTDSGGFQVFSLSKIRKIMPQGVEFNSHLDGSKHTLTPKKVLEIQKIIGSDIAMILDVCPSSKDTKAKIKEAVDLTTLWAQEAKKYKKVLTSSQLMFGIVQGGLHRDLREESLKELIKLDFNGYAIGGLAVGESHKEMYAVLDYLAPQMPENKPRYLMGVGTPENIVEAVRRGVDMFDCVIPTREARHGRLYVSLSLRGSRKATKQSRRLLRFARNDSWYETINITNAKFKNDKTPINNTNLKEYSRAYLHHLFKTKEPLALRLATLNNLEFYLTLMSDIRQAIRKGNL